LREKGNIKKTGFPNFWGREINKNKVSMELKEYVYNQYFSRDTLWVYCDMSMNLKGGGMSVACSYVTNCQITVKQQYVYPPADSSHKSIFGELRAVIFALTHFEKYMLNATNIVIFSDINTIEDLMNNVAIFKKNPSLLKQQSEMQQLYRKAIAKHPEKKIIVQYLTSNHKAFNPFYRSAHNAARELLTR
jgi:ribonuclease HI